MKDELWDYCLQSSEYHTMYSVEQCETIQARVDYKSLFLALQILLQVRFHIPKRDYKAQSLSEQEGIEFCT